MGIPVFILGRSGTGKSTSLRNFKSDEILHINVMSKPLPFRGRFAEKYDGDNYVEIVKAMNSTEKKTIVIDDAQYLMANEFMRRSSEKGYDKFTEIGFNFWNLIEGVNSGLPYDTIVYFLMHTDADVDGNEKAKTIGKLLDEKITIEGMTSIVLKTAVKDGVYTFTTQNNGHDTVKSPLGMFKTFEIENDLKAVDERIREYWELDVPFEHSGEIMAAHDAEVDAGGVSTDAPKAEKSSRRRRDRTADTEPEPEKTESESGARRRRDRSAAEAPAEETPANDTPETEDATEGRRTRRRRRDA